MIYDWLRLFDRRGIVVAPTIVRLLIVTHCFTLFLLILTDSPPLSSQSQLSNQHTWTNQPNSSAQKSKDQVKVECQVPSSKSGAPPVSRDLAWTPLLSPNLKFTATDWETPPVALNTAPKPRFLKKF